MAPSRKRKADELYDGANDSGADIDRSSSPSQSLSRATTADPETPSKRGRGRPKGARNRRTPTPEGEIPPEERYFFQNRAGPANARPVSNNSFSQLGLLTVDEYMEISKRYADPHDLEIRYLLKMHKRAFPQWRVELEEQFNICLYGWGSKRALVLEFAEYLCRCSEKRGLPSPKIVVLNGYTSKQNMRSILNTINTAVHIDPEEDVDDQPAPPKLHGQPNDMLDALLTKLDNTDHPVWLLVNTMDSPSMRRLQTQATLARLASHSKIRLLATCDTPTFRSLWSSTLQDQFGFVFHDATTFAKYEAEIPDVVGAVEDLLGRKGRRVGGKDGVMFVLKSLPENARRLFTLLLSEVLTILGETGMSNDPADDDDEIFSKLTPRKSRGNQKSKRKSMGAEEVTVEYRTLYQKASEEFICSSDMNFRFLLKEFADHQMITSRRDVGGTEVLSVPLGREEMEAVLEDLVVGE